MTVFDLRQETHIFVNGLPVSWYASRDWANVGRSQPEIKAGEAVRLQSLKPESEIWEPLRLNISMKSFL